MAAPPEPWSGRRASASTSDAASADSWWARRPLLLLLWYLSPHLSGIATRAGTPTREARLWAHVLRLRLDARKQRSGALWYRAMQPTLGLLWAEAAGRLSYRATWMYVTDGGHYDNLGLVEALRRGASHIVVLDASGDKADTWFTLGGAIALARADAGVDIDLDPTTMVRGGRELAPGQVVRPWAHGRFTGRERCRRPAAPAGRDLGVQARLVDRRALGRPGLRQGPSDLPLRQHAGAVVRRHRVRGLSAARRGHGPGCGPAVHAAAAVDPPV